MNDKISAPFTQEQVQNLVNFQKSGMHPFTCCGHDGCNRGDDLSNGVLIPIEQGWICPCGKYRQYWAHAFMADPASVAFFKEQLEAIKSGKYKVLIQPTSHNETDPT